MITKAKARNLKSPSNSSQLPDTEFMTASGETSRTQRHEPRRKDDGKLKLKNVTFSTYNVQTLYQTGKFDQLTRQAKEMPVDIIGIQEHRWKTSNIIEQQWSDDGEALFVYSTATKMRTGGVGLLIKKKHVPSYRTADKVSDRILKVYFQGNPMVTVVVAYGPTEGAKEEDKDQFWDDLSKAVSSESPHNITIILGDLNARVGDDSHKQNSQVIGRCNYHSITNDNGKRLLDLCHKTQFRELQSRFPHPKKRLWTWRSPVGTVSQLDHILINSKWVRSAKNCRAYNSLEIGSDHRIVSARLNISLRATKKRPCKRVKYNWCKLAQDQEIQQRFSLALSNRFSELTPTTNSIQNSYNDTVHTIEDVAQEVLGNPPKKRAKSWVTSETVHLVEKRNTAKRRFCRSKTSRAKENWKHLSQLVQKAYQKDEQNFINKQINKLDQANRQGATKKSWQIINDIGGKSYSNPASKVKTTGGKVIKSNRELLENWKNYFKDLYNQPSDQNTRDIPPARENLNIPEGDFTMSEFKAAKRSLNDYKAPGIDYSITAEALKHGGDSLDNRLLALCNDVKNQLRSPTQWTENLIVPLPKKGDRSKMSNYRGISLMSISAKLYNRLLLNRIRKPLEEKLRANQAGFRPGRGCLEHIHVLRRILEGSKQKNIPVLATFIDFKKAFDSINRNTLFKILRHYGVPESITNAIKVLYTATKSSVLIDGELTEYFDVLTGVLQGDVLAPFLFIIVVDWVLRNSNMDHLGFVTKPRRSRRQPEERLGDLEFADDISLLEHTQTGAQEQVNSLSSTAKEVGLVINDDKTKFIAINIPENPTLELEGLSLERVEDFKYLGSYVVSAEKDFKHRRGKAWGAFWTMKNIWYSKLNLQLKVRLLRSAVLSVLLYGSETWVLTKALEKMLNSFFCTCLRIIMDIKSEDRVTNEEVCRRANVRPLSVIVQERQLRFLGHSLRRSPADPISNLALFTPPYGHANRGRQPTTFPAYISNTINFQIPITPNEIQRAAQDRDGWRRLVEAACSRNSTGG